MSSIIIDLKSVIERSFASASLTVTQSAVHGAISQLDPYLLKYTPNTDFQQGTDKIVVSVRLDDGSIRKGVVDIIMKEDIREFPCEVYSLEDRIELKPKKAVTFHPLRNDQNCGVKGLVNVSVHISPQFGDAVVVGDSIIYTPGPSFEFRDELIYRLSNGPEDLAYGIVSIKEMAYEPITLPAGFGDFISVNDEVGFAASGIEILKTVDGGTHWDVLFTQKIDNDPAGIGDIFFLDEKHGFAAMSKHSWDSP